MRNWQTHRAEGGPEAARAKDTGGAFLPDGYRASVRDDEKGSGQTVVEAARSKSPNYTLNTGNLLRTVCVFSRARLLRPPRTVVHQTPLSVGFSRQEHGSGLPFPSPGDLCNSVSDGACRSPMGCARYAGQLRCVGFTSVKLLRETPWAESWLCPVPTTRPSSSSSKCVKQGGCKHDLVCP